MTKGFQLTNVAGQGFRRWCNNHEDIFGDLTHELRQIYVTQSVFGYKVAEGYVKTRAKELFLDFRVLTEEDYRKEFPFKSFLERIL